MNKPTNNCIIGALVGCLVSVLLFSSGAAQDPQIDSFLEKSASFDYLRFREKWTLKRLVDEADLVLAFSVPQDREIKHDVPLPKELSAGNENVITVQCKLNPDVIFKSPIKWDKNAEVVLQLVIWRDQPGFSSGPRFVSWFEPRQSAEEKNDETPKSYWLGFLKKSANSEAFEPVAGQYFGDYSFRELSIPERK